MNISSKYNMFDYLESEEDSYLPTEELRDKIEELEDSIEGIKEANRHSFKNRLLFLFYVFGLVMATTLSFNLNNSVFLAFLHGFLSWLYVIYRIFL